MRFPPRPHKVIRLLAVSAIAIAFSAAAQAPLDIRIALVIGNAAYAGNAALANPANDARAMGETLKQLGFTVVEVRDGSKTQMTEAVAKVRDTLKGKQGVGMLYYAGHGLQLDWRNYMVPVDAKLTKAADVSEQTVDLNSVIDAFKTAGNRMNIVVLDACRDNPFTGSTASGKGLAQLDAPPGTFLAYATAPGNVAEDGDAKSGNGLYTQFLLEELKKPTAKIEDVFKRVRLNVRKQSQGRQIPWESTSLEDDFYFNSGVKIETAKPDARAKEAAFNVEKADWDKIKDSKNADDFYAFLQKYPNGFTSEAAQSRLQTLAKALIVAAPAQGKPELAVRSNERFQLNDKYFLVERSAATMLERRRITRVVTAVSGDTAELDNGALVQTNSGGTVRVTSSGFRINFDPPLMTLPAGDFQVGQKWTTRSTMALPWPLGKGWIEQSIKTVGRETIQTEAGTFDTFKTEMTGASFNGTTTEITYWCDPAFGYPVKMHWMERERGKVTKNFIQEWYKKPERS